MSNLRPSEILSQHRAEVLEIVAATGYANLRVWGTVVRGEDVPGEHLDLLVDVPADAGYFAVLGVQAEVSDLLGIEVRLQPQSSDSPRLDPWNQQQLDAAKGL